MYTPTAERYKTALEAKAAELSRTLSNRNLIAIEHTPEECEQMVLAAQREMALVALDRDSRLLREVNAALARIADGSYGICENCEGEIKPKRLEAVPWARFCVECQEQMDPGPYRGATRPALALRLAA